MLFPLLLAPAISVRGSSVISCLAIDLKFFTNMELIKATPPYAAIRSVFDILLH